MVDTYEKEYEIDKELECYLDILANEDFGEEFYREFDFDDLEDLENLEENEE